MTSVRTADEGQDDCKERNTIKMFRFCAVYGSASRNRTTLVDALITL